MFASLGLDGARGLDYHLARMSSSRIDSDIVILYATLRTCPSDKCQKNLLVQFVFHLSIEKNNVLFIAIVLALTRSR